MKDRKGAAIAILLTATLLFAFYSFHILNADHLTYGDGGDGYKNFYTLAYYLKYDHGFTFDGMIYPYGDNMIFSDCQPIVARLLKPLCSLFPGLTDHVHGMVAWFIFLSIIGAAYFIYKILREFEVDQINAGIFASAIAILSPQIQRLMGHFSLGHVVFIPLLLYLLIRFFRTNGSIKVFAAITATITFFTFIHIYYLAMAAIFIMLVAGFYSLSKLPQLFKHIRFIALLCASAVIPFIVLKAYLLFTDHVTDRPQIPWGFIESRSQPIDIFTHKYSFTSAIAKAMFPKTPFNYSFEGMGYLGFVPELALLIGIIVMAIQFIRRKKLPANYYPIGMLLAAGFIVLLFAMAFPFCLDGFEKYYDNMPTALKQFRASGRFNWVFYYTAAIAATLLIYSLFKYLLSKNKAGAYIFLVTIYSIWFIDIRMVSAKNNIEFKNITSEAYEPKDGADLKQLLAQQGKTIDSFQCIMPLPFFLVGSERVVIDNTWSGLPMKTSLYTGLPLASDLMSRTSERETFNILDLISDEYISKQPILNDYKNKKPLLMLTQGNEFKPAEQALISKGKYLFTFKDAKYYELPLEAFSDNIAATKDHFAQNRNAYFDHGNYLSTSAANTVLYKSFNEEEKDYAAFGKGAHYSHKEGPAFYFDTLPGAKDNTEYELSLWVYADKRRSTFPVIYSSQIDTAEKNVGEHYLIGSSGNNVFDRWMRVSARFTLYNHKNRIMISTWEQYASVDEIMVRPVGDTVITNVQSNSNFNFNNYPIR